MTDEPVVPHQTPKRCIGYDVNDRPYTVYRFEMEDGSYLDVDAAIADASGNRKAFLRAEYVRNYLGLGGWH